MFQKKKTQTRLSRQVINLSDAVPLSVRNDEANPPIVRELVLFFCVCLFQIAGDMYLIRTPSTVVEIPYVLYLLDAARRQGSRSDFQAYLQSRVVCHE